MAGFKEYFCTTCRGSSVGYWTNKNGADIGACKKHWHGPYKCQSCGKVMELDGFFSGKCGAVCKECWDFGR